MAFGDATSIARLPFFAPHCAIMSISIGAIEGVEMSLGNHWFYPKNLKWILLGFPNQAAAGD
jgi:hypothetical protein